MKRAGMILLICVALCVCASALGDESRSPYEAVMYYNPDGGQYAHLDANCSSVSLTYLPLKVLPNEQLARMNPCPYCAGNTPLFSAGGGGSLPNLSIDVYPTSISNEEWLDEKVYRIHIVDNDNPSHVFTDLLFPSMEGDDGLALLLKTEDMNFDGYPDLKALRVMGASNAFSTFFLYRPEDGQFHYEQMFDNVSAYALYPEWKLISNSIHDSAATGIRELYRVLEDGRPRLFRQASVLYDEQSNGTKIRIKVTEYGPDAETILMEEVREPFTSDADYLQSEQKWLALLYEGMPEDMIQRERGE